jgi:hypothetical protein
MLSTGLASFSKQIRQPAFWVNLGLLVLLCVSCGPQVLKHMQYAMKQDVYNDDVLQQIWPFLQYYDRHLLRGDYIAQYYLDCFLPVGYKTLYILWAGFSDPRVLSKLLPYPALLVLLLAMARAGWRLSGLMGLWVSVFLVSGITYFLYRMTGGLPRMFAFPLLALMFVSLLEARPWWMAALTVFASLFYPVIAVVGGVTLACWLLLADSNRRGLNERWTLFRRMMLLAGTALLCLLSVAPLLKGSHDYGGRISTREIDQFPELRSGGRYDLSDSYPFPSLPMDVSRTTTMMVYGVGSYWPWIGLWADKTMAIGACNVRWCFLWGSWVLGFVVLCVGSWGNPAYYRFMLLFCVCAFLQVLSRLIYPTLFMPARYVEYVLPIFQVLITPLGWIALAKYLGKKIHQPKVAYSLAVLLCVLCVLINGKRGSATAGFSSGKSHALPITDVLAQLPENVLIAGWFNEPIKDVPYLCGRSVLVDLEVHQILHHDYALEMRRRTMAVIKAYYPHKLADVLQLRDEFGVTHMLWRKSHFQTKSAVYFKPYDDVIRSQIKSTTIRSLLNTDLRNAVVYEDQQFILVDLTKLP